MPTYEYACTSCGQHLEVVQSFSDDPLTRCPHCGGDLRKVFGNIGIVLKGSGFYKTDSRSSKSSTKAARSRDGGDQAASTASGGDGGGGAADTAAKGAGAGSEKGADAGTRQAAKDGAPKAAKPASV